MQTCQAAARVTRIKPSPSLLEVATAKDLKAAGHDLADLTAGEPDADRKDDVTGTVKETLGQVNDPVIVGGELIRPGEIIRGNAGGLVVVRSEDAASVVDLSAAREVAKAGYIEAYKAGKSVMR